MGVIRRYIAPAIGILMTTFVVVNVQFGLIAPEIIDGAGPAKLDVMKMLEPHCAISEIDPPPAREIMRSAAPAAMRIPNTSKNAKGL